MLSELKVFKGCFVVKIDAGVPVLCWPVWQNALFLQRQNSRPQKITERRGIYLLLSKSGSVYYCSCLAFQSYYISFFLPSPCQVRGLCAPSTEIFLSCLRVMKIKYCFSQNLEVLTKISSIQERWQGLLIQSLLLWDFLRNRCDSGHILSVNCWPFICDLRISEELDA